MAQLDPAREAYVSLATFRKTGREVRTPVWVAADPEDPRGRRAFVYTNAKSGKVKRIRANGRARLAACDVRGRVRGAFAEASARVVSDAQTVERGFAALRAKYGWQLALALGASRLSGRYADRAILELTLAEGSAGGVVAGEA